MPTIDRHDPQQWEVLTDYVQDLARRMGLTVWHIWVSKGPPANCGPDDTADADTAAVASTSYCSLTAKLCFGDIFFTLTDAEQRQVVVHELVHVIQAQRNSVTDSLESCGCLGRREYTLWHTMYEYADERVTDWLAHLIAEQFPTPPWEGKESQ